MSLIGTSQEIKFCFCHKIGQKGTNFNLNVSMMVIYQLLLSAKIKKDIIANSRITELFIYQAMGLRGCLY